MKSFFIIWFGQFVSQIGSGLSGFALGVWVFQQTGSATQFAATILLNVLPNLILGPFAGALVDRWDRRKVMACSDAGACLTLALAFLLTGGNLQVWHVYAITLAMSCCGVFRWLAYSAVTVLLLPKQQLGRADGLNQLGQAAAPILSPLLAGVLVMTVRIQGILLIDLATFVFSLTLLLMVRIPKAQPSKEGDERKSLWAQVTYGWTYIMARQGLLLLLIFFALTNFAISFLLVLIVPLILSFASAAVLGSLMSLSGAGLLAGSLATSVWGGPKRRVYGIVALWSVQGLLLVLGGFQVNAVLIGVMMFGNLFCAPLVQSCSQVIWQSKTALDVQGRVFAVRRMIGYSCTPLAYLLAGPLTDKIFEPLLADHGPLATTVGRVIGVGPGRGIGFLLITLGVFTIAMAATAFMFPRLRNLEEELPDAIEEKLPPPPVEELLAVDHDELSVGA